MKSNALVLDVHRTMTEGTKTRGKQEETRRKQEQTLSDTAGAMAVKGNPASFEQEDGVSGLGEDLTSNTVHYPKYKQAS